jgi:hypothetical protein
VTDEAKLQGPKIGLANRDVLDEVARAHEVIGVDVTEKPVVRRLA